MYHLVLHVITAVIFILNVWWGYRLGRKHPGERWQALLVGVLSAATLGAAAALAREWRLAAILSLTAVCSGVAQELGSRRSERRGSAETERAAEAP